MRAHLLRRLARVVFLQFLLCLLEAICFLWLWPAKAPSRYLNYAGVGNDSFAISYAFLLSFMKRAEFTAQLEETLAWNR
jgi:hypothetical protein